MVQTRMSLGGRSTPGIFFQSHIFLSRSHISEGIIAAALLGMGVHNFVF